MEQLFPDPDPEPDWEPFLGLTPESAFNVAERLDKDFARDRLLEFESVPSYYRNYEHRICLQALYDAVSDNSRFPFVRTRLEPKVSVLTLSYNHAEFIEDTIKSVIAQRTNFPIQHIIGDDSSDDGTQEIILDYASKYPHIIPVFQQKCSTGWLNIRTLFEMPRTPYVALCDGDDFFTDPEKLQKQVDFLETHKDCALCFHPVRVTYEDSLGGERIYPPPELLPRGIRPFYYLSDLIKCNLMQTNSVMYRWRFVKGLPDWFHSALFPADWYWHLLHAELGKIGFINTIMSVYRRHKNSAYYTAEIDRREHRYKTGFFELHTYRVVNDHFKGDYWNIISSIADGVLADMLVYSSKINDQTLLKEVADEFPLFVSHFLQKVGRARLLPE